MQHQSTHTEVVHDRDRLVAAVRRNCYITDARHARDMTLCTYLLEMREYCRWEHGIPSGGVLPPRAEIATWLNKREALWDAMADRDYGPIPAGGEDHDPFDTSAINRDLQDSGLIYGAGIGRFHKPHFFLAQLVREDRREGLRVVICGQEYARDLSALPAVLRDDSIVIRGEALRQWLWEKIEAWQAKRTDGALKATLDSHDYDIDAGDAIERLAEAQTEALVLHELGEHAAGKLLGPAWERMLAASSSNHAEILARAVRDNLADCLVTLPTLLDQDARGSLHFWFANFDGMRLALFPELAAAYREWQVCDDAHALREVLARGADHWRSVADDLLVRHSLGASR